MLKARFYPRTFMTSCPVRNTRSSPLRAVALAVVFGCGAVGCAGGTGSKVLAQTPARVGTSVAVPSSSSASIAPTTTVMSDEAAARQVYGDFLAMIAVVGDPPNPDHPMVTATTTGALLARVREALTTRRDLGRRSTGGYRSSIESVQLAGDTAVILDCALDESVGYGSDGGRGVPDTQWYLRSAQLTRTPDGWRVAEFVKGDPCTPAS